MNRQIYIIGAGGFGLEIGAYVKHINSDFMLKGYFDDQQTGSLNNLAPIIGKLSDVTKLSAGTNLFLGIGTPKIKRKAFNKITKTEKFQFPSLIQPQVFIADKNQVTQGRGCCICAGSRLTTNISLGEFVLINLNVTIGHHVDIGDFSSIMPGANISGNVRIGKEVLVGSGATVLRGIEIGDHAIIGAGAVVTKNVAANSIVVGVPAKPINI